MSETTAMPDDFFGTIYVECESLDQLDWLASQGINASAWISFIDVIRREIHDGLVSGALTMDAALDGALAASMQAAWVGARRWAVAP